MKNIIYAFFIISILTGCATDHYGYTEEEWKNLNEEQRKEAKANIKKLKEHQHDREMTNKFINDLFGTRSNQF